MNNDNESTTVVVPEPNPFAERAAIEAASNTIDLISPLKRLEETALRVWRSSNTEFRDGYLMGIRHAIELAGIMQWRIDMQLTREDQLTK